MRNPHLPTRGEETAFALLLLAAIVTLLVPVVDWLIHL